MRMNLEESSKKKTSKTLGLSILHNFKKNNIYHINRVRFKYYSITKSVRVLTNIL